MAMMTREPGVRVRSRAVGIDRAGVGVGRMPSIFLITDPTPRRCWTIAENEERFHGRGPPTSSSKATTRGMTNCKVGNLSELPGQPGPKYPEAVGARETAAIERTDGQCRRLSNPSCLV